MYIYVLISLYLHTGRPCRPVGKQGGCLYASARCAQTTMLVHSSCAHTRTLTHTHTHTTDYFEEERPANQAHR